MATIILKCGHAVEYPLMTEYDKANNGSRYAKRLCTPCFNASPRGQALQAEDADRVWDVRTEAYMPRGWREREAVELARLEALPAVSRRTRPACLVCGATAEMHASRGPACPDHYDELSG